MGNTALKSFGVQVEERVLSAVEKINAGSKFNGVFYKTSEGHLNIYIDGKLVSLYRTKNKEHLSELENIVKSMIEAKETKNSPHANEWLVNEKKVTNSLNYAQMWDKYGTDFE